ncbi:MAG TPA: hypothetical protein VJZ00_06630, partial [Thermoanaerobaculia bacterium]|nr:hypothetical protein [Thermoanaerobaculia bacterium]
DKVSLTAPFAHILRASKTTRVPIALVFVFFCATFVALTNLAAAFSIGEWLATAIGGFDAPRWQLLFSGQNRRFILMLFAGAILIVEPFWIAAQVVFVRKAGAEESGDDLKAWFEELRKAS